MRGIYFLFNKIAGWSNGGKAEKYVAAALIHKCSVFVTNDRKIPDIQRASGTSAQRLLNPYLKNETYKF
jgi:hypothetical protein